MIDNIVCPYFQMATESTLYLFWESHGRGVELGSEEQQATFEGVPLAQICSSGQPTN